MGFSLVVLTAFELISVLPTAFELISIVLEGSSLTLLLGLPDDDLKYLCMGDEYDCMAPDDDDDDDDGDDDSGNSDDESFLSSSLLMSGDVVVVVDVVVVGWMIMFVETLLMSPR